MTAVAFNQKCPMARRFAEHPTLAARALQIWQILIGFASRHETITYKRLASMLGYRGCGVLGRQLGHIMCWCARNELPALTSIVINETNDEPGDGLVLHGDHEAERQRVFAEDWYAIYPPSERELAEAWEAWMPEAADAE